jgi:hypothetical protein
MDTVELCQLFAHVSVMDTLLIDLQDARCAEEETKQEKGGWA